MDQNDERDDLLEDSPDEDSEADEPLPGTEQIAEVIQVNRSKPQGLTLILSSLFLFVSSTVLLVVLPIYIECGRRCGVAGYSKTVTLTAASAVIFAVSWAVIRVTKSCIPSWKSRVRLHLNLPDALKLSCVASSALFIFYIDNAQLVSCHLQDPLKGCVVVFSFAFYFVHAKRKMSVERVFCTITVIVGTFIAVDFGLCDRYKCRGAATGRVKATPMSYHAIYIIGYILALAAYAFHLTMLENCCRFINYSSNLDVSIVSSESSKDYSNSPMPITQSLSIISGGRPGGQRTNNAASVLGRERALTQRLEAGRDRNAWSRTLARLEAGRGQNMVEVSGRERAFTQLQDIPTLSRDPNTTAQGRGNVSGDFAPDCPLPDRTFANELEPGRELTLGRDLVLTMPSGPARFPVTSTPNEVRRMRTWEPHDWLVVYHGFLFFLVMLACWLPSVPLFNKDPKLIEDTIQETLSEIGSHFGTEKCPLLWIPSVILLLSYWLFSLSLMSVLTQSQSAITVVSVVMNSLPMTAVFWSIYQLNASSGDILTFGLTITGETVSALLGFPVIGMGTFLLLKSHITTRDFLHLRLR